MLNLKNFTIMKKIFTLAIIALASVAMVACCGQAEKKCDKAEPATEVVCDKNCAECDKKNECPQATPAETPAETPAPEAPAAK